MLQRVIELLKPDVSTDAKLTGVSLLLGKTLEKYDSRLKTLEIKTLIPIERGEQGRPGRDGEVDYKKVHKYLDAALEGKKELEMVDIDKIMENTWDKW